jgi:hypothetical protein
MDLADMANRDPLLMEIDPLPTRAEYDLEIMENAFDVYRNDDGEVSWNSIEAEENALNVYCNDDGEVSGNSMEAEENALNVYCNNDGEVSGTTMEAEENALNVYCNNDGEVSGNTMETEQNALNVYRNDGDEGSGNTMEAVENYDETTCSRIDVSDRTEFCRICAKKSQNLIGIFSDEGKEKQLDMKIHALLLIKVNMGKK